MTLRHSRRWTTWSLPGVLGALLLVGCAAPQPSLHLDVRLADGERLGGRGFDRAIVLETGQDRERLPLSDVRRIQDNGDGETVTLTLADGLRRRGVLGGAVLEVIPPGQTAERRVAWDDVRALGVLPRLRIAGSGGAWWDPTFESARGFDVTNVVGRVRVTGIDAEVVNHASHGTWGIARLTHALRRARDDFDLGATLAWDDEGAGVRAMQRLVISAVGPDGEEVAAVGHHDVWSGETGSRFSSFGGASDESGYDSESPSGRCSVRIVREAGRVDVRWNGRTIRTGSSRVPVARVVVSFEFYAYDQGGVKSEFGSVTLEKLSIR